MYGRGIMDFLKTKCLLLDGFDFEEWKNFISLKWNEKKLQEFDKKSIL